ncbi:PREDICTED: gamma-aminobutyric acid receptor subunit delta-like [Tauraco erythrolophus]|uniref:gamma-aminobutyric acid receptor subunit delta-like n=1 Tax=Tauraco erythrolophus TaxID=121530 RepID=UPI0005233A52|nr:PREDICTED: gamma-aminobutyric acid receptor subunit delta-like [Tauraco erythrolophus]
MKIYSVRVEVIGYPFLLHLGPEDASEMEEHGETMQHAGESEACILPEQNSKLIDSTEAKLDISEEEFISPWHSLGGCQWPVGAGAAPCRPPWETSPYVGAGAYTVLRVSEGCLEQARCSLGHVSDLHGRDTTSLPGFENLTMGYNKYLRPYFGGEPVQIAMSLDIASISSISESDMDYTATIYLRQRWTDPRLVFHGNKSFTLDARLVELLWVPDTYIVESKRSFLHDVTVGNRLIRLFSNGTILYALR